jgi:hypothetical protein
MFAARHALQKQIRSGSKPQILSPLASIDFQVDLSMTRLGAPQLHQLPFVLFACQ